MPSVLFDALKKQIGFESSESSLLGALSPRLKAHFPAVVEEFFQRILLDPEANRYISGPRQIDRLREKFRRWLVTLFEGPHNSAYFSNRFSIGLAHVRIGLPLTDALVAFSRVRRQLERALRKETSNEQDLLERGLAALEKILDLDLAIITCAYHGAEKYLDFVERSPQAVLEVAHWGNILTANTAAQRRLGCEIGKLEGRSLEDLVLEADLPLLSKHIRDVFEKGEARSEVRLKTPGGQDLEVELLGTAERDSFTGAVVRAREMVLDMSRQRRAERELETRCLQQAAVAELGREALAGPDVLPLLDEACQMATRTLGADLGAIFSVLPGGAGLLLRAGVGWRAEEVGRATVPPGRASQAGYAVLHGRSVIVEDSGTETRFDASPLLEDCSVTSGVSAVICGVPEPFGVLSIHSKRKRLFTQHDVNFLEALSNILAAAIERRRVDAALRSQEGLVEVGKAAAMVAHEVKQPMAAISSAIQVISAQLPPRSPLRAIIQEVVARLETLSATASDLQRFSRPREAHVAAVSIRSLLEDITTLLLQDPDFRGVHVGFEGTDVVVQSDAELLKLLFSNLLFNAAQAMSGTGEIAVSITGSGGVCQVWVTDTGPGVPTELRERVFEPFFTTKSCGTGLGLPTARRIAEAHGGRLAIVDHSGPGARLLVELPVKPSMPWSPSGKPEGGKPGAGPQSILLA